MDQQQPPQYQQPPPQQQWMMMPPPQQQQQTQPPPAWAQQAPVPPPQAQPQMAPPPQQQQYVAAPQASNPEEIRSLWIGDLQPWMEENYLWGCFSQTGEVYHMCVIFFVFYLFDGKLLLRELFFYKLGSV